MFSLNFSYESRYKVFVVGYRGCARSITSFVGAAFRRVSRCVEDSNKGVVVGLRDYTRAATLIGVRYCRRVFSLSCFRDLFVV